MVQESTIKKAYTFPAIESTEPLCQCCEHFDETKYREAESSKGYCKARNMILYRTDFDVCIDFKGVIPDITKELKD
jgi:hypothetical protein